MYLSHAIPRQTPRPAQGAANSSLTPCYSSAIASGAATPTMAPPLPQRNNDCSGDGVHGDAKVIAKQQWERR
ncbi:hypothetical protein EI94DRAFT_1760915 [Lactarius quietus]|nr:hypothetical protein EI94DRAFT_1760915 [Lactarius quietus]